MGYGWELKSVPVNINSQQQLAERRSDLVRQQLVADQGYEHLIREHVLDGKDRVV